MDSTDPDSGIDGAQPSGKYLSSAVGVRISTATFGTGFNFCIGAHALFYCLQALPSGWHCGPRGGAASPQPANMHKVGSNHAGPPN